MAKFVYYILFLLVCFLEYLLVRDAYIDIAVNKKGEIVNAEIKQVNCNRRNSNLYISYTNANHSIMIPYTDCLKGKYQVGDSITVRALPEYRRTQFPNSYAYGGIFIAIIFLILLLLWILARKEIIQHLSGKVDSKSG